MDILTSPSSSKRRPVNLTIREDILETAKSLNLNASQAAEAGLIAAIRQTQEKEWLNANKSALRAHNKRVEKDGVLLNPPWASE